MNERIVLVFDERVFSLPRLDALAGGLAGTLTGRGVWAGDWCRGWMR